MKPKQRIRLSLSISEEVYERIQRLLHDTEAETQTEVIRKALVLYERVLKLAKEKKLPLGLELS